MAVIDKDKAYETVNEKIKSSRTYLEVKRDAKKLRKELKNNLEKNKKKVTTTVEKVKEKKKSFQRKVRTQFDELLNVAQFNSGNGSATIRYIKSKFIRATLNIQPKLLEILFKEVISAIGCSQQQVYSAQTLYIKVKSVDVQNFLKRDPQDPVASVAAYEKDEPTAGVYPYSMNRELYKRLQNINQPFEFFSSTGALLFKISYVQSTPAGLTGDFFKVELQNPGPNLDKIVDFIVNYYKSIQVVDFTNIFAQLMDQLTGAISIQAKFGSGELEVKSKFLLLLQRVLGLCFDSKKEIDVSGNAKVAELDGIDESFFELTDLDLREIDQTISNITLGVTEFEDCENVLLPVNSQSVINNLIKLNKEPDINKLQDLIDRLTDSLVNDERWRIRFPNSVSIELAVDTDFLKNLPKAIMMAILSPKVLLPLMIMLKSVQQNVVDFIEDLNDLFIKLRKFVVNMMSKIGALFVQELFELIRKDIRRLVSEIVNDVARETTNKKLTIILRLIEIALVVARAVDDWRKCKSVVDELLALLAIAGPSIKLPGFLLAATELLNGFSSTRAGINIIEEFQKVGLPTGPMPDGSPNLMLVSLLGNIRGIQKEEDENGKVQLFVKPLTQTPAGITLPNGFVFGKKM